MNEGKTYNWGNQKLLQTLSKIDPRNWAHLGLRLGLMRTVVLMLGLQRTFQNHSRSWTLPGARASEKSQLLLKNHPT